MSSKKKHIDELFKEGLKNLSLLVTDKDLDAIDGKTSVFKDANVNSEKGAFDNFELEVTDFDWQATKAKLDKEKSQLEVDDTVGAKFKGFEIQPDPEDWPITYKKYRDIKRKRVAMWWWLSTGVVVLVAGLSVLLMGNEKSNEIVSAQSAPTVLENNNYDQTIVQNDKSKSLNEDIISDKDIDHSQEVNASDNSNQIKESPIATGNRQGQSNSKGNSSVKSKNSKLKNLLVVQEPVKELEFNFDPNKEKVIKTNSDFSKLKENSITPPNRIKELNPEMEGKIVDQPVLPIALEPVLDSTENKDTKKDNGKGPTGPTPQPMLGWYMGAVTQVAYTSRVLGASNNQMYNSIRRNGDKGFVQLGFGFEFGYRMKKDQVSIGAQVTEQNWNSHYSYSYRVYDSIPFIDINGNVTYFLFRGRDTSMDESVNIKISRIEVPFRYDRRLTVNDKMDLSLGFGAVFGINSAFRGNRFLYAANNQMYPYHKWSSMERRFTLSPSISFGCQYKLNKRYILQTDLSGSIYAMSRFKPALGTQDFPYSIGMNVKLIYLLKK